MLVKPAAASAHLVAPSASTRSTAGQVEALSGKPLCLPSWCANETGRALIAQILADPPETRTYVNGLGGKSDEFAGVPAARLRRLFGCESARLLAIADAEYAAGKPWPEAVRTWTSFVHGEGVDKLIERLLRGQSS